MLMCNLYFSGGCLHLKNTAKTSMSQIIQGKEIQRARKVTRSTDAPKLIKLLLLEHTLQSLSLLVYSRYPVILLQSLPKCSC